MMDDVIDGWCSQWMMMNQWLWMINGIDDDGDDDGWWWNNDGDDR